jgi:single-strand DNA-binding protein
MAASLNRVFLMGNLTRDPELRYIPSGTAVTSFTIAVNRTYASQAGEKKEEVSFIKIIVWGRRAEVCGQYLSKGSPVFVEGRLRSRSWKTTDGQNRSTIEVIAGSVQFLRGANKPQEPGTADMAPQEEAEAADLNNTEGAGGGAVPNNGSEEEIPF